MLDIAGKTFDAILAEMLDRVPDELNKRDGSLIKTSLSAAAWAMVRCTAIEGMTFLLYTQK